MHYERRAVPRDGDTDAGLFLDVKVPLWSEHRKPSAFLANILENVKAAEPETVAIRWPRRLKPAIFQMLKHTLSSGEWSQSAAGGYSLRWRSDYVGGNFRGIAWVDNEEEFTRVVIACETLEAVPVPLKYLLPGLTDLVDLMLAIRS